jgi:hypothetical protein
MKNKLFLTESEKSRISSLHRTAIINESKNNLNEATLTDIQNLIATKLGANVLGPKGADGKLGSYTLNAIYSALTQTQGGGNVNQQPATGTQNPAGTQNPDGTQNQAKFVPKAGMEGKGIMQDEAEGRTYAVVSVKPFECGITEVVFKGPKRNDGTFVYPQIFAYYNLSNQSEEVSSKEISFRSVGDGGAKSNNPCTEYDSLDGFGRLQFS